MLTVKNGSKTDWANMPLSEMAFGNVADTYYTLRLFNILLPKIKSLGMEPIHKTLFGDLILMLADLELEGMIIDTERLENLAPELEQKVNDSKLKVHEFKEVGAEDNLASTKDLSNILFLKEDGFGLFPPFRTKKTNSPQVDKNALETLETLLEDELELRHEE